MKARKLLVLIAVASCLGILVPVLLHFLGSKVNTESERRIRMADHGALLSACRQILADYERYTQLSGEEIPDWRTGPVLDLHSEEIRDFVPKAITDAGIRVIHLSDDRLILRTGSKVALVVFADDEPEYPGAEELIEDLWLVGGRSAK